MSSEISDIEIHLSEIKVTNMSYEYADKVINENEVLSKLNDIAISHKAFRADNGAIKLTFQTLTLKLKTKRFLLGLKKIVIAEI